MSALPGIIQLFDPDAVTAAVQPAILYVGIDNDRNRITRPYSLLRDVSVVFPSTGGVTLTRPVKAGDECELKFQGRCIDFFWQNGGVQEPVDDRIHDLSDATCSVGQISQPNKNLAIRKRILETRGVKSILSFNTTANTMTLRVQFFTEIDTLYGITTVTSEA